MSENNGSAQNPDPNPNRKGNEEGALWSIMGYLLSGLLIWGGIGWGLDHWLGTHFLLLVGLLLGGGASMYLVWLRFGRQ